MDKKNSSERPEVYALRQKGENWQISRRDFLKTAGLGAAAAGIGLSRRFVRHAFAETDPAEFCKIATAHRTGILEMRLSADGNYLLSMDFDHVWKCWDFRTYELLSQMQEDEAMKDSMMKMGTVGGKPVVLFSLSGDTISYREIPDLSESSERTISITAGGEARRIGSAVTDRNGNIYILKNCDTDNVIRLEPGDGSYERQTVVFSSGDKFANRPTSILGFLENDTKILVCLRFGDLAVLDPVSGTLERIWDFYNELFVPVPGDRSVFVFDYLYKKYSLFSLVTGEVEWEQTWKTHNYDFKARGAAITPDASMAVMLATYQDNLAVLLIDLKDGSVIKLQKLHDGGGCDEIFISNDGTQCVAAVYNSIIYMSLPDLSIIGCSIDRDDVSRKKQIIMPDKTTGETVELTLFCGEEQPDYSVCVCNCVSVPVEPDKAPACRCDSYISVPPTYWYPN